MGRFVLSVFVSFCVLQACFAQYARPVIDDDDDFGYVPPSPASPQQNQPQDEQNTVSNNPSVSPQDDISNNLLNPRQPAPPQEPASFSFMRLGGYGFDNGVVPNTFSLAPPKEMLPELVPAGVRIRTPSGVVVSVKGRPGLYGIHPTPPPDVTFGPRKPAPKPEIVYLSQTNPRTQTPIVQSTPIINKVETYDSNPQRPANRPRYSPNNVPNVELNTPLRNTKFEIPATPNRGQSVPDIYNQRVVPNIVRQNRVTYQPVISAPPVVNEVIVPNIQTTRPPRKSIYRDEQIHIPSAGQFGLRLKPLDQNGHNIVPEAPRVRIQRPLQQRNDYSSQPFQAPTRRPIVENEISLVREPAVPVREPARVVQRPVQIVRRPQSLNEPVSVIERPQQIVNVPIGVVRQPVQQIQRPFEVSGNPISTRPSAIGEGPVQIEVPAQIVNSNSQKVGRPNVVVQQPIRPAVQPITNSKELVEIIEQPGDIARRPVAGIQEQIVRRPQIIQRPESVVPQRVVGRPINNRPTTQGQIPIQGNEIPVQIVNQPVDISRRPVQGIQEVVDLPVGIIQRPVQISEVPVQIIENPQFGVPQLPVVGVPENVNRPIQIVRRPIAQIQAPIHVNEIPVQIVGSPIGVVPNPVGGIQQVIERPIEVVRRPIPQLPSPIQVNEIPVQVIGQPVGISQPIGNIQRPIEQTQEVLNRPINVVRQPVGQIQLPIQVNQVPVPVVGQPIKISRRPVQQVVNRPIGVVNRPVSALQTPIQVPLQTVTRRPVNNVVQRRPAEPIGPESVNEIANLPPSSTPARVQAPNLDNQQPNGFSFMRIGGYGFDNGEVPESYRLQPAREMLPELVPAGVRVRTPSGVVVSVRGRPGLYGIHPTPPPAPSNLPRKPVPKPEIVYLNQVTTPKPNIIISQVEPIPQRIRVVSSSVPNRSSQSSTSVGDRPVFTNSRPVGPTAVQIPVQQPKSPGSGGYGNDLSDFEDAEEIQPVITSKVSGVQSEIRASVSSDQQAKNGIPTSDVNVQIGNINEGPYTFHHRHSHGNGFAFVKLGVPSYQKMQA